MKTLFSLALLLCLPLVVAAQSFDMSLSFGAANAGNRVIGRLGVPDEEQGIDGTPITVGSGFMFAPRFTYHQRGHLSHEFSYAFTRGGLLVRSGNETFLDQGMSVSQLFYNALLSATPEGSRIRPYGTVGAGLLSFYPPGFGLFSGVTVNRPAVNYGAGIRFQVNEIWHGRVDYRQALSPSPRLFQVQQNEGGFRQNQFSVGVGITF
jgi:opacity protein-like surface antigen